METHPSLEKKKISSAAMSIYKFLFPAVWVFVFLNIARFSRFDPTILMVFGVPTFFILWFSVKLKWVSFDENYLYVSSFLKMIRVDLSQVNKVYWAFLNPSFLGISFKEKNHFGKLVYTIPKGFMRLFWNPFVEEFQRKIERKKLIQ